MKKRLFSLVLSLCLISSLMPAAFAGASEGSDPETIIGPNGQIWEIPTVEPPIVPYSDNTVVINTMQDFDNISQTDWYANKTFELNCDIDLSKAARQPAEWGGYIQYFYGTLRGNGHKIYNFANNTAFIYGNIGGTISNLVLEMNGNAGQIAYLPVNFTGNPHLTLQDISVTGHVNLSGGDQSNYSPFIYVGGKGGLSMIRCKNYADISGDIYGGVFFGYYPMYNGSATYTFTDCENHGNITLRNAALFFGNSSKFEDSNFTNDLTVQITGCKNYGDLHGSISSNYFATPLTDTAPVGYCAAMENSLLSDPAKLALGTPACKDALCTHKNDAKHDGKNSRGPVLAGLAISESDGTLTITTPQDASAVDHYVVSVSSYVSLWNSLKQNFDGETARYTVSQTINKGSTGNHESITADLKFYGVADNDFGDPGTDILDYYTREKDGKTYYEIDQDVIAMKDHVSYATGVLTDGQPGNGSSAPAFASVYAYRADGSLLGFASLEK